MSINARQHCKGVSFLYPLLLLVQITWGTFLEKKFIFIYLFKLPHWHSGKALYTASQPYHLVNVIFGIKLLDYSAVFHRGTVKSNFFCHTKYFCLVFPCPKSSKKRSCSIFFFEVSFFLSFQKTNKDFVLK